MTPAGVTALTSGVIKQTEIQLFGPLLGAASPAEAGLTREAGLQPDTRGATAAGQGSPDPHSPLQPGASASHLISLTKSKVQDFQAFFFLILREGVTFKSS